MVVIEFACKVKQGHFEEVQELYSAFAADFLSTHEALETVLVFADQTAGEVRGLGVYETREAADAVSNDPEFVAFNDAPNWRGIFVDHQFFYCEFQLGVVGGFTIAQKFAPNLFEDYCIHAPDSKSCRISPQTRSCAPVSAKGRDFK